MISSIAEILVNRLVKKEIISGKDIEVYQFGIECFIMKACHIISYFIIAICFHMVLELLIFLMTFMPLRVYAGGYHANTPMKCYIVSCFAVLSVMCLIHLMPTYIMQYSIIVALVVSFVLLIIVPVESRNKTLDETEKIYYKRKAMMLIMIEVGIVIIFRILLWNDISFIIALGMTYELGVALAGKISLADKPLLSN